MKPSGWIFVAFSVLALGLTPARAEDADWRDCAQQQDRDQEIRGCSRILARGEAETSENRAIAYYNRGLAYYAKGDNDRAIADYDQAIRLNPKDADAYSGRGDAYATKGDMDRAIADFDQAIRLNPNFTDAYSTRGAAYFYKRDLHRAIADFDQAIRLNPKDASNYSDRAEARARKGDLDGALADCDAALRLDPKDVGAYIYRAYALGKKGQLARAFAAIAEAFKLDPKNSDAFLYRGELHLLNGNAKLALEDFEAALAEKPYNSFALAGRDAAKLALAASQPAASAALAPAVSLSPPAPAPLVAPLNKRVALVIGNGAYKSVPALPNPPRDAAAMAALFRAAGFDDVKIETNLGAAAMRAALRAFAEKVDDDIAVVFYAGHGVEIGGHNYLVPVDAALRTDRDVEDEAIDLKRVLTLLAPVRRLKLVILDACRENPFASRMRMTVATREVQRGLKAPELRSSNTLVAYAAGEGAVANDGEGANSPFTRALLNNLTRPGLDVRIALGKVYDEVSQATHNRQEPAIYGQVGGDTLALAPAK